MGKPLPIKLYETLLNLLNMYTYKDEEVLVLEAVANAIDAKAKKIDITFEQGKNYGYITFHNDGTPMNKQDFENYHTVSLSSKTKGEGIGFAGVGAKIFLASPEGGEIVTITGRDSHNFLASVMYRQGRDVEYDTSSDSISKIIGKKKINHKYGTSYIVRLSLKAYQSLKEKITPILQFWFNYAIMSKQIDLTVDRTKVKAWEPGGDRFQKTIIWKKQKINCYFWISKEEIPEDQRHITYSVFGKRIKNESVDYAYQIKGDKNNKVFCLADVSVLAKWLNSNKEDFQRNSPTGNLRSAIKAEFYRFLDEHGLLQKTINKLSSNVVVNELTRAIDRALQSKELRFLSLYSNPQMRLTVVADDEGDITISPVEGSQKGKGTMGRSGKGGGTDIGGEDEGSGVAQDEDDGDVGRTKEQKSRGLSIIVEDFPKDPREGWVDPDNKAVVYNSSHSFNQMFSEKNTFDYNLARVVISSLIKFRNEQVQMDARTTLELFEKVLHSVWK
ncbi:MAG: sensor histidine kinase [Thaumarchaeota archaeon]|nr:sensor histidine kinase [Nitrososphaerota archaeon]